MALREELEQQGDFLFRHRSHLPLALVVAGLWVKAHQERFGGAASETLAAELLEASAATIGLIGLAVRVLAVGYTPRDTSGRNTREGQVAETLNTTGAYSLTRNPLYLGNYLMWLAVAMATGSPWFVALFSLVFWLYYERIIYTEEAFLRRRFGSAYTEWAARTPVFLPSRLRPVRPESRFSWRKVLKKEKNALFALFLLLCAVNLVGDVAEGQLSVEEERASITAAALTGVLYVTLRALKKHTSLLDEEGR